MDLLHMALALLIAAQQPNVPVEYKNMAINLANSAIEMSIEQASSTAATQAAINGGGDNPGLVVDWTHCRRVVAGECIDRLKINQH